MSDHKENLKSMLQHIINDNTDEATAVMHDYFVSKTREVAGLGGEQTQEDPELDDNDE